jgi:hypothetical protein
MGLGSSATMHRKRRARFTRGISQQMTKFKKALKKKNCGTATTALANVAFFAGGALAETKGTDKSKKVGYTRKRAMKMSGTKRMNSALKAFKKVCHAAPKKK